MLKLLKALKGKRLGNDFEGYAGVRSAIRPFTK
jgi:hypothetical protein